MANPSLHARQQQDATSIYVSGVWTLANLDHVKALPEINKTGTVSLNGGSLEALDPSGAHRLMTELSKAGLNPDSVGLLNFTPSAEQVWRMVLEKTATMEAPEPVTELSFLGKTGKEAIKIWGNVHGVVGFLGEIGLEVVRLARKPGSFRTKEFVAQMEAVFVYAIPISAAMLFLLGVVFAYLMGVQAQKFGANIFVVDGVAAAVLRELSPVIVAILVAGRTGAAITAQLGTMKVNEEIDALSVMGLSPVAVLVVPRLLALVLSLPLLVYVGDMAGLLGGMVVAKSQLGLEYSQYIERLNSVLQLKTVLVGMLKAPVFAIFIGLIACRMGMTVARDAQSVGVHTTSTVVQSIVAVIILNAIFAVAFTEMGI